MEELGKCVYCGEPVIHREHHDYGAFGKRWDAKAHKYILSKFWHMSCYQNEMSAYYKRLMDFGKEREPKQLTIFDIEM